MLCITDGRAKPLMDRKVVEVSSLSLSFSDCLATYLPIYLSIYRSIYLSNLSFSLSSVYLTIYLSIHLSIYLSIYLSLSRSVCLSVCLSIYLSICKLQKPSYSARLLHFSKLTTSKTQQFCVTSSFFKVDNIKNETILRDLLIVRS